MSQRVMSWLLDGVHGEWMPDLSPFQSPGALTLLFTPRPSSWPGPTACYPVHPVHHLLALLAACVSPPSLPPEVLHSAAKTILRGTQLSLYHIPLIKGDKSSRLLCKWREGEGTLTFETPQMLSSLIPLRWILFSPILQVWKQFCVLPEVRW